MFKKNKVIRIFPYIDTSENTENIYALRGYMFNVFIKQKYVFLGDYFGVYFCLTSYPTIGKEETWEVVWSVKWAYGSFWFCLNSEKWHQTKVGRSFRSSCTSKSTYPQLFWRKIIRNPPMILMEAELENKWNN